MFFTLISTSLLGVLTPLIGLVLMTIGVYTVVSWAVTQQGREIGIRMVLGASASGCPHHGPRRHAAVRADGCGGGHRAAWVVGRVLASQLWGGSGYPPVTLCGMIAVLIAVGWRLRAIAARDTGGSGCLPSLGMKQQSARVIPA